MEVEAIGWVILALTLLAFLVWLIVPLVQWTGRWSVKVRKIPVRFGDGVMVTQELTTALRQSMEALEIELTRTFPHESKLRKYQVEVVLPGEISTPSVPSGKLPDGSLVAGSIRTERPHIFLPLRYVAVITTDRPGPFLIHEVIRHLTPWRMHGDQDHDHNLQGFDEIEEAAKREYQRIFHEERQGKL